MELYERLENKKGIVYSLNSLGSSSYLNQNHKRALGHLERANELSKEIESMGYELITELYLNLCYKYFDQKIDLKKIQDILEKTENVGYTTNFHLYELLGDKTYLESAYNQIHEISDKMSDELKKQFLNYPIPK